MSYSHSDYHLLTITTWLIAGSFYYPMRSRIFFKVFRWYFIWPQAQICVFRGTHSLKNLYILKHRHRRPDRPSVRNTGTPMFNLTLSSLFGSLQPDIVHPRCDQLTAVKSVYADHYRLTVHQAQLSTHWVRVLFEIIRWQVTTFQMIAGVQFLENWKFCLLAALLKFDFKLTSDAKIQPAFTDREVSFDLSHHCHELVTIYVQFLCSDWSKFDRWVHAGNLCNILKLFYW